jgi:Fic family protein
VERSGRDEPITNRMEWAQYLIARDEALESGHFRGEGKEQLTPGVGLGTRGRYMPPRTEPGGENLRRIHARGVQFIKVELDHSFEQAIAYFLFAALQQFYFDGNKRTARYMMNGHLMSHGFDSISVPAARRHEFNAGMVEFFTTKEGQACSVSSFPAAPKVTGESSRAPA